MNKIDTNDLKVMKGFVTSYGWVKNKTYSPIDDKVIPDHICADFDDDCYDLPQTHWHCWEDQPECGICPFGWGYFSSWFITLTGVRIFWCLTH